MMSCLIQQSAERGTVGYLYRPDDPAIFADCEAVVTTA
jgi:hypothetical protein